MFDLESGLSSMLTEMSPLSKIFAVLSIVCYLVTSSIASAHALPMKSNLGGSDRVTSITKMDSAEDEGDELKDQQLTTMMACHQSANTSAEMVKASGLCKIFCSAIGHAFLSSEAAIVVSIFHPTSPNTEISTLTTRQLSVEHQPPK